MRYHILIESYHSAIDGALALVAERRGSSGAQGMADLLATVWDPLNPLDIVGTLMLLDLQVREIALDLIVGRLCWGRPIDHPKAEVIARLCRDRYLESKCLPKIPAPPAIS